MREDGEPIPGVGYATVQRNLKSAAVAQWIERFPPEEEVVGSSPTGRATVDSRA